jgi:hypothetical protein
MSLNITVSHQVELLYKHTKPLTTRQWHFLCCRCNSYITMTQSQKNGMHCEDKVGIKVGEVPYALCMHGDYVSMLEQTVLCKFTFIFTECH